MPSRFASCSSSIFDNASTIDVIRNRIRPSSIRADEYVSPTASVNSLASAEAMLLPGASSDALSHPRELGLGYARLSDLQIQTIDDATAALRRYVTSSSSSTRNPAG